MGIVRRHPFLSIVVALMLSPLLVLGGIAIAQRLPACSEWRARVEAETDLRMSTRYSGDGVAQEFDRAYALWETTFEQTRRDVRAQVALDLSRARPDLCL